MLFRMQVIFVFYAAERVFCMQVNFCFRMQVDLFFILFLFAGGFFCRLHVCIFLSSCELMFRSQVILCSYAGFLFCLLTVLSYVGELVSYAGERVFRLHVYLFSSTCYCYMYASSLCFHLYVTFLFRLQVNVFVACM